jgi:hypothetical protein
MMRIFLLLALTTVLGGCEPRKPAEPKPPVPKVDFTHERSSS